MTPTATPVKDDLDNKPTRQDYKEIADQTGSISHDSVEVPSITEEVYISVADTGSIAQRLDSPEANCNIFYR